jgi:uncharacterized protein (DUF433 family)
MNAEKIDEWKRTRVSVDPDVLAGEATFCGTRLSIRHIGKLANRVPADVILEDYPYLSPEDIVFAKAFTVENPR